MDQTSTIFLHGIIQAAVAIHGDLGRGDLVNGDRVNGDRDLGRGDLVNGDRVNGDRDLGHFQDNFHAELPGTALPGDSRRAGVRAAAPPAITPVPLPYWH